jgi:hypothetical protein
MKMDENKINYKIGDTVWVKIPKGYKTEFGNTLIEYVGPAKIDNTFLKSTCDLTVSLSFPFSVFRDGNDPNATLCSVYEDIIKYKII